MTIAIIGAMPQEIELIKANMQVHKEHQFAGRTYYEGSYCGQDIILVLARIGKVAAAITTTVLFTKFKVDSVILTGVAGAASEQLNIGDIVISDGLVHHDIDASPMFPKHEVPYLGVAVFKPEQKMIAGIHHAASKFISDVTDHIDRAQLKSFGIEQPSVCMGMIASGDQFIKCAETLAEINTSIAALQSSKLQCVEMEGSAVAQVCHEFGKPFVVVRTISDKANHEAPIDFNKFISEIASHYSHGVLQSYFSQI